MKAEAGLAAERTRLAWRRTALAGTVVALLSTRLAATNVDAPAGTALTALSVCGWPVILLVAFRRLRNMGPDRPVPADRAVGLVLLTVGYAALGITMVLLGGSS